MMSILVRPTDAENHSVAPIRNHLGIKTMKPTSSVSLSTTESQTETSQNFRNQESEKDTNQISMDIETQTGGVL